MYVYEAERTNMLPNYFNGEQEENTAEHDI